MFGSFFGQQAAQPATSAQPTPAPATPAQPATPAPASPQPAGAVTDPATGLPVQPATPAPTTPQSPLDQYANLWQPKQQQGQQSQLTDFGLNGTPQQFVDAAKTLNFASLVTPEIQAAITAGGDQATTALTNVISNVGQAAFAQALMASQAMVKQALTNARGQFSSQVPELVKSQLVAGQLFDTNAAYQHPAVAPVINALHAQATRDFPNATPVEISQYVNNYMQTLGSVFGPKSQEPAAPKIPGMVDNWDAWANG